MLVQTALASHLLTPVEHSFMSLQFLPFPLNPVLHLHVYPPRVLVQTALASHFLAPVEHSSMSEKEIRSYLYFVSLILGSDENPQIYDGLPLTRAKRPCNSNIIISP